MADSKFLNKILTKISNDLQFLGKLIFSICLQEYLFSLPFYILRLFMPNLSRYFGSAWIGDLNFFKTFIKESYLKGNLEEY